MKTPFKRIILASAMILTVAIASGQELYTPYDELPGMIKSYKPSYSENSPNWAKMLYDYPVNATKVNSKFIDYMHENPGLKSPMIRYYKLWSRAVSPYIDNNGEILMPDLEKIEKELLAWQEKSGSRTELKSLSSSDWSFLGPKDTYWLNSSGSSTPPKSCPWQVNIYAFDVAASNNDILYCGTETGLMNKTTDQGLNWQQLGTDYPFGGGVSAVVIHPENADIVYVAAGSQIHKTVDGGSNWTPMLPSSGRFGANRMKIDPNNPEKIIAGANEGVYLTTNGGANWIKKSSFRTWDVDIKPDDSNIMYALITNGSGNYMIQLSTDGGISFSSKSYPTDIPEGSGGLLAVTPDNPNLVFTIMLSSEDEGTPYLYKGAYVAATSNIGWIKIADGKTNAFEMNNGQGYFDLVLEVSPNDQNMIFVGTTTFFKSVDGGNNFTVIGGYWGDFSIHPDIQDLKLLPSGNTWVSTDGGFSYTTDNFISTSNYYSRNNGIVGSDMWGFDQGWNEDIIVGGRYHNGNTALADFYGDKALRMGGAESPTGWVIHGKSRHVAFDDLGNGWILPKTAESAHDGRFVFSKFPNMVEYGGRRGNLLHHPRYYNIIFVGEGTGFWVSSNMGTSFDLYHTFPGEVRYMQISFSNPNVIYADIVGYGLYQTEDGGENWERKPSLTAGSYGNSGWNGKLFFAVSPTNGNVIYSCLSNGAWSADKGKVFKSTDGGDSWTDYSGSVSEFLKCIVVQPDASGRDLVYLFTTSKQGATAKVLYRNYSMSDWEDYSINYPAGMNVNLAMPFFRDSKLRVGGSASVWESPLAEKNFYPIINPWVGNAVYNCSADTLYFDDHSILNHEGATWNWSISPEPAYISDANIRNPKVILGTPGSYDVSMSVEKDGQTYSKTLYSMVTSTTCPSINDCSNPAIIPTDRWSVVYVDSEEIPWGRFAENAFDGDDETFWHTAWSQSNPAPPHEIQIDMDTIYEVHSFTYMPRQSSSNGRIKGYELYFSEELDNWGSPVKTGNFENSTAPQEIKFSTPIVGRYFRLVALSEVNDNAWSSVAEITLKGCYIVKEDTTGINSEIIQNRYLTAFPVPADNVVNISLPSTGTHTYKVYNAVGQLSEEGIIDNSSDTFVLHLNDYTPGMYIIHMTDKNKVLYRAKFLKY